MARTFLFLFRLVESVVYVESRHWGTSMAGRKLGRQMVPDCDEPEWMRMLLEERRPGNPFMGSATG